jgi:hypothetical protein
VVDLFKVMAEQLSRAKPKKIHNKINWDSSTYQLEACSQDWIGPRDVVIDGANIGRWYV